MAAGGHYAARGGSGQPRRPPKSRFAERARAPALRVATARPRSVDACSPQLPPGRPMHPRAIVDFLAEQLVESTDAHHRERALLCAVCGAHGDVAAELWRDFGATPATPTGPSGWLATRSHGARHALPAQALVVAALAGAVDGEFGEHAAVICAGALAPGLALVVAG